MIGKRKFIGVVTAIGLSIAARGAERTDVYPDSNRAPLGKEAQARVVEMENALTAKEDLAKDIEQLEKELIELRDVEHVNLRLPAIQRMIDQMKLQDPFHPLYHLLRVGPHHHSLTNGGVAGNL